MVLEQRIHLLRAVYLLFVVLSAASAVDWDVVTDLDTYVQSDDGFFSWQQIATYDYNGVTIYILNMTSQQYQDESFSSQPIWWHIMGVAVPDEIDYNDFGILWISGGSNTDPVPPENEATNVLISSLANDTKVISAYMKQVPNQPIVFARDPGVEKSDEYIIGETWRTYLDAATPDNTVLARMPMTKAAKRGLDTLNAFANGFGADLQRFGVAGGSERGWTTWSLAATDQRVVAIMPLVFSYIDMPQTLMGHYQKMDGAWSFALDPYYSAGITADLLNPLMDGVFEVEDMLYYQERFTIPIVAIASSGDEFFLSDESIYWWNSIPSTNKYILMLANCDHLLAPHYPKIYTSAVNIILTFLQELPYPSISWVMSSTDTVFTTNPPPDDIRAYRAQTLGNDTRRDFRLDAGNPSALHPVWWRDVPVETLDVGVYRVAEDEVPGEWVGFYLEGEWTGPAGTRMVFTSQINVVPNTYPSPPCTDATSCTGSLV